MPILHRVLLDNPMLDNHQTVVSETARALGVSSLSRLGSGCYANVYAHPIYPDKVIKITKFEDASYTVFLRGILRYQDKGKPCPWLPRIYGATQFHIMRPTQDRRHWSRVLVVTLDRLIGISEGHSGKLNAEQLEVLESLRRKRISSIETGALTNRKDFSKLAGSRFAQRQLRRAENVIRWAAQKAGSCVDLHWENAMFSPSGQLVITDPLA